MSNQNWGLTKICVEKHIIPNFHSLGTEQRALFLSSTLWVNGSSITVGFYPVPEKAPQWYTIDQLTTNVPQGYSVDPIEFKARQISNIPDAVKYVIQQRLQPLVNIKFVFVDDVSTADVRVAFDTTKGSNSFVGTQIKDVDPTEPTMNLAWLDVGTFIHEFCHTLGMVHEHQTPFGFPIQWNLPVLYKWGESTQGWDQNETYQQIVKKYNTDQVNGSVYDPYSVMLYFFSPSLTLNNQGTTENHQLSVMDKQWLSSIYPFVGPRIFPTQSLDNTLYNLDQLIPGTNIQVIYVVYGVLCFIMIVSFFVVIYYYKYFNKPT